MDRSVELIEPNAKRGTLASTVYDRLRQDVLTGVLMPGGKLRIEALRQRYDVGASPVREALNRLVSEGLVRLEDQKGFRVASVSLDELYELTRTRSMINEVALRESIARGDAAWEERIVVAFHRMQRTFRTNADAIERARTHRDFHCALTDACGSRWIASFSELLFDSAQRYRGLAFNVSDGLRDIDAEHRAIMDAVLARDTDLAVKSLNEHVARTAEIVSQMDALRMLASVA